MGVLITPVVCEDRPQDVRICRYDIGDMRRVFIQSPDGVELVYEVPELDESKLPPGNDNVSLGISTVVGWPRWFPVFNRRRLTIMEYPIKDK